MPNEEMNQEKRVMKNPNEYRIGDRLYVEKIKSCSCTEKRGDVYFLWCKIHQRGNNYYLYEPGTDCLRTDWTGKKRLYLSEAAQQTVDQTVRQFDEETSKEVLNYYVKVEIYEGKVTIWYRRLSRSRFAAVLTYPDDEGFLCKEYFPATGLESLIRELSYGFSAPWRKLFPEGACPIEELRSGTPEGVERNPLYISAGASGDVLMQKQLKIVYRVASPEDCAWLAEKSGKPVLPALPEAYDRKYYVRTDSIDFDLLHRSGYQLLHRPYFAMKGSTHEAYSLNPHTKYGVDAAPENTEFMDFKAYLELFRPFSDTADQGVSEAL